MQVDRPTCGQRGNRTDTGNRFEKSLDTQNKALSTENGCYLFTCRRRAGGGERRGREGRRGGRGDRAPGRRGRARRAGRWARRPGAESPSRARPPPCGTAGARLRAPLSLRNPAGIQRTPRPPPPPRAGVKEHPSPLVTGTKTRGPSRRVKVQAAAAPRLLPEGGGTRQGRRDAPRPRPLRAFSPCTLR